MIVDLQVFLGRWPFQSLVYDTVDGVLKLLDRAGIDRAVVSSLNSVFYHDSEIGNREVGAAVAQYPDRFVPFTVVNPNLLSWKDHLKECVECYGSKGVKLHPDYHKYSLTGERADEVIQEARGYELPVQIQTSIMDMRHHPGYCLVQEIPTAEVASTIRSHPEVNFIVGGGKHFAGKAAELIRIIPEADNYSLLTDGLGGPFDGLTDFVTKLGAGRLLFSTRTPILYTEAARLVLDHSPIAEADKARILGVNAVALLGL